MNILIIGNGFDLAHGLKTRYTDFLKYCEDEPKAGGNIWRNYFVKTYKSMGNKNWTGFEDEISRIVEAFEESKFEVEKIDDKSYISNVNGIGEFLGYIVHGADKRVDDSGFPIERYELRSPYSFSKTDLIERLYEKLKDFVNEFRKYCIREINHKECGNWLFREVNYDAVLSFNYTDTMKKIYDFSSEKCCYIHGQASNSGYGKLVMGSNETLESVKNNEEINENNNFDFSKFKKYFQRIMYKTGSEYKDWLNSVDENGCNSHHNVHIVGHSLDKTDRDVLTEFFINENCDINIYYHDEKSHIDKIQKTISIVGKDKLIKWVHGRNARIKFFDQHNAKHGIFTKKAK
jgi:hypothetical protein